MKKAVVGFSERDMKPASSTNRDPAVSKPGSEEPKHLDPDQGKRPRAASDAVITPAEPVAKASPPDEELIEEYRNGNKAAFTMLVERYQRELYHFLVRFVGNRAAAEDVFQEAFLQVHQSVEMFDTQRRFRPWLFTIAANKARDLMRAQSRRPTTPLQASIDSNDEDGGQFIDLMQASANMPDRPLERQETQQAVQKIIMAMPAHLREIVLLSYFHQFPYKQIADILGIPLGTVKSRLHAAVAQFADRWRSVNQRHSLS